MSQATQSKPGQTGGPRGKRAPVYGRGPPGGVKGNGDRPKRPRREPVEEVWIPKTNLGKKVKKKIQDFCQWSLIGFLNF